MGSIVAGLAHELSNPLAFVLPNLEQAIEAVERVQGEAGDANAEVMRQLRERLRDAVVGAQRIAQVVGELQVFHDVPGSGATAVDLDEVVRDALARQADGLSRLTVHRRLGNVGPVWANAERLGQVVEMLLRNAAASMPARRRAGRNHLHLRTQGEGARVRLEVLDNGCGPIDASAPESVFDPFCSRSHGSSGMGLALCANLVQQMNGSLEVASARGGGSRFTLYMPRAANSFAALPEGQLGEDGPRLRVLVAEDEPLIARTLRRQLSPRCDVTIVGSGEAAVARLARAERYDCILTDVVMPNGGGIELHRWVEENRHDLRGRVVFMTGMVRPGKLCELPEAPLIAKPFSTSQLSELLGRFEPLAASPAA